MKAVTHVVLYENNLKFFGEGPRRLLHGIEKKGSLRAAALEMNLSYSKALIMLKRAEEALGFPLTEKIIGGKGGGGSHLTEKGKIFLEKFDKYQEACCETNSRIFNEIFSN